MPEWNVGSRGDANTNTGRGIVQSGAAESKKWIRRERMTDENGAVVDGDWERDFVFDGDRAWDANCAIADNDCGERNEGAPGRDLERLLAGFFR